MIMSETSKPPYILTVLKNKCPRCREGDLFVSKNPYALKDSKYIKMHESCPKCGQPTEIEVGFYYGTSYVSYAIGVLLVIIIFILWWLTFGFSISDNSLFYFIAVISVFLVVIQPPLMRLSRSLWLSWFVKYDPNWRDNKADNYERIVKEHMNNW
jgi:uncharacterized protein (DUF983 family)